MITRVLKERDLAKYHVRKAYDLRLLNIIQLFLAVVLQNYSDTIVTASGNLAFAQKTKKKRQKLGMIREHIVLG